MLRITFTAALLAVFAFGGCTVRRDPPDLVGQDVRLTLIHTSDIHSRLFPYFFVPNRFDQGYGLLPQNAPFGGMARMATIVKREREAARRSLWFDSGDCFQGAPVFNMFKGEAEIRSLSQAGMDGAVVGNHEFDLGAQNLLEQIDNWAQYPFLAANYAFDDPVNPDRKGLSDVVQPYAVYDVDGLKVGVIGMANWSSMTGIFEGGNSLGLRPLEDAQVVREYVRLLRPSVDVLILLSHLGLDEDQGLATDNDAEDGVDVRSIPLEGVDVILGGHLHIVLNPPKVVEHGEGEQTVLVHSGAFAKYVGRLDLVVRVGENNGDPAKRSRVTAFSYDNIPVDSTVAPDPGVTELLWPYSVALNKEIDLDGVFSYVCAGDPGQCGDKILRNDLSGGDSQLGNLVARSMQIRSGVEADFAITNSLGIRADFEPGPLTIEQMFNVFPFENSITVMYLSGSEVQETLDFIARKSASRGCRTQGQVAGIAFDMVCDGACPGGRTACAKNVLIGDDCRMNSDPDGPVDPSRCPPLEPTGLYRVAVNDYIARGGSGFEALKRNTSKQDTGISLRDALIDFLRTRGSCCESSGDQCVLGTDTLIDFTDPQARPVAELWGEVSCLRELEQHDGRIRAVFE
ncbi:MAG TPA: bifunctional UDP-sugar hydrolase/5'-nucleotidase [Kofleriaceae bacterium]|nr:bifunctional UDP-sugar hydrolase/5'-nucleotidase [Kofleriaceae bacterium]